MTRDPGLQPERTALAWQRTGIATVLVASGAALAAAHGGDRRDALVALGALVVSAAAAIPGGPRSLRCPYGRLLRAAVGVIAVAAAGVVFVVS